jgi:hypothetical protein
MCCILAGYVKAHSSVTSHASESFSASYSIEYLEILEALHSSHNRNVCPPPICCKKCLVISFGPMYIEILLQDILAIDVLTGFLGLLFHLKKTLILCLHLRPLEAQTMKICLLVVLITKAIPCVMVYFNTSFTKLYLFWAPTEIDIVLTFL